MNTLTKKTDENPHNLLRSLLYTKPLESEETKYGKSMEPHGFQNFISKNKRLDLIEENPFIQASPDSNIDCSCCGSELLEVKCSSSIKRKSQFCNTRRK